MTVAACVKNAAGAAVTTDIVRVTAKVFTVIIKRRATTAATEASSTTIYRFIFI